MPYGSHGGLFISKGKQLRPTLSMGVRHPLVEVIFTKCMGVAIIWSRQVSKPRIMQVTALE